MRYRQYLRSATFQDLYQFRKYSTERLRVQRTGYTNCNQPTVFEMLALEDSEPQKFRFSAISIELTGSGFFVRIEPLPNVRTKSINIKEA